MHGNQIYVVHRNRLDTTAILLDLLRRTERKAVLVLKQHALAQLEARAKVELHSRSAIKHSGKPR